MSCSADPLLGLALIGLGCTQVATALALAVAWHRSHRRSTQAVSERQLLINRGGWRL